MLNLFRRCVSCNNRTIPFLRTTCPDGKLSMHFLCHLRFKQAMFYQDESECKRIVMNMIKVLDNGLVQSSTQSQEGKEE